MITLLGSHSTSFCPLRATIELCKTSFWGKPCALRLSHIKGTSIVSKRRMSFWSLTSHQGYRACLLYTFINRWKLVMSLLLDYCEYVISNVSLIYCFISFGYITTWFQDYVILRITHSVFSNHASSVHFPVVWRGSCSSHFHHRVLDSLLLIINILPGLRCYLIMLINLHIS